MLETTFCARLVQALGCLVNVMDKQRLSSQPNSTQPSLGVWRALIVGWLVVNIPVIIIILGILLIGIAIEPHIWWLFLAIGFFLGWAWWSYTIPRWRKWALHRGAPPARLKKWAVAVGLTWPKDPVSEKTESRIDE